MLGSWPSMNVGAVSLLGTKVSDTFTFLAIYTQDFDLLSLVDMGWSRIHPASIASDQG